MAACLYGISVKADWKDPIRPFSGLRWLTHMTSLRNPSAVASGQTSKMPDAAGPNGEFRLWQTGVRVASCDMDPFMQTRLCLWGMRHGLDPRLRRQLIKKKNPSWIIKNHHHGVLCCSEWPYTFPATPREISQQCDLFVKVSRQCCLVQPQPP